MKGMILAAAVAVLGAAAPAWAASVTIDFTGGSDSTSGTAGNSKSFSGGGVNLTVKGWSTTDSTPDSGSSRSAGYLGRYSNGLGVTNVSELNGTQTHTNAHTVDNYNGIYDFLEFKFSEDVTVTQVVLDMYSVNSTTDGDISIHFADAWYGDVFQHLSSSSSTDPRVWNITGTLSDSFHMFASLTMPVDGFKVKSITFDVPTNNHVVPLPPAAWAGLGLLAGLGAFRTWKRRRAVDLTI